jgi:hypothetical protein
MRLTFSLAIVTINVGKVLQPPLDRKGRPSAQMATLSYDFAEDGHMAILAVMASLAIYGSTQRFRVRLHVFPGLLSHLLFSPIAQFGARFLQG